MSSNNGINWEEIKEPIRDSNNDIIDYGKPIFTKAAGEDDGNSDDVEGNESDNGDEEDVKDEPLYMPRLQVTEQNIPQLEAGEMVVMDEDGTLVSTSVDEDGELNMTTVQLEEDNTVELSWHDSWHEQAMRAL